MLAPGRHCRPQSGLGWTLAVSADKAPRLVRGAVEPSREERTCCQLRWKGIPTPTMPEAPVWSINRLPTCAQL